MNQQEAYQLLALVHSMSTFESRASEEALGLQAGAWAAVLEDVPYAFATGFVISQAKQGVSVREAARIAAGWASHRKEAIGRAVSELVPPDELAPAAQGRWLQIARKAVGDGATPAQASGYADQHFQVARQLTAAASPVVSADESVARIRKLAAQWGAERREKASSRAGR